MVYTLKLPRLGEGIFEAQVVNLYVEKGMSVTEDEILADMQTDKAAGELQSPVDGIISDILIKEGDFIYQGSPLILIDDGSETPPDLKNTSSIYQGPSYQNSKKLENTDRSKHSVTVANNQQLIEPKEKSRMLNSQSKEKKTPSIQFENKDDLKVFNHEHVGKSNQSKVNQACEKEQPDSSFSLSLFDNNRYKKRKAQAMMNVKKYAKEREVDLDLLGEVDEVFTKEKVDDLINSQRIDSPKKPFKPINQYTPDYVSLRPEYEERIELNYIRKFNASTFEMQHRIVPPFTIFETIDMAPLLEFINKLDGFSSYLPFIIKALTLTAKRYPRLNAVLDDSVAQFVYKKYYNVGLDINTVQGMFTPVIKDTDQKSIEKIDEEAKQLSDDINSKIFEWENLSDATITITDCSNLPTGAGYFTPMIHYPQAACLGLGSLCELPVVYEGEVVAQTSLPISLTVDYRVVDRIEAFGATAFLKQLIESPATLLIK